MQNVVVLGGSYGGARGAQLLAQGLRRNYRLILIDRNSHANHLYVIPRLGVLPGHEHKAFIPYKNLYHSNLDSATHVNHEHHLILHANVTSVDAHSVTIDRTFPEHGLHSQTIPFKFALYALGSHLPAPINLWAKENIVDRTGDQEKLPGGPNLSFNGTKAEGIEWLRRCQERIKQAGSVLVVGGGALGIQFASDIASLYPTKKVTLLHSRHRLLPRFDYDMHNEILKALEDLRVDTILGERLDLSTTTPDAIKFNALGQRVVRTLKGREIAADLLLLCTGQTPNTSFIQELSPNSVDPASKLAYVLPTMQLGIRPAESSVPPSPAKTPSELSRSLESLDLAESDTASVSTAESVESEAESDVDAEPELEKTPYRDIFVVGDAADAFGAIKAGHNAYFQAEVAARNIIALANRDSEDDEVKLERYRPGPPGIKVSLGVGRKSVYQINGVIGTKDTPEADDLEAGYIWEYYGMKGVTEQDMYE